MPTRLHEVTSKRSEHSKHWLNDDGSFTAEICAEAVHYKHADGDWLDIDNTLILSDDANYDYMCVTTDIPIYVKRRIAGETENIKVTRGGVTVLIKSGVGLTLVDAQGNRVASALNTVSPQLDGEMQNRACFPGVHLQGDKTLDIDYHVHSGIIHEEFVCSEAIGFPEITQEVELSGGYAVRDGKQIVIRSSATDEIVLTIPAPVMFEQDDSEDGNHDLDYVITGDLGSTFQITKVLEPDGATWFFAAERQYPLVVDSDFVATKSYHLYSQNSSKYSARNTANPYISVNDLYLGAELSYWYYYHRGYLKFDTSTIGTNFVLDVSLTMTCQNSNTYTNQYDVLIVKQDWSTQDPITSANALNVFVNTVTAPLDNAIWRNTSGLSHDNIPLTHTSASLSNTWVNTTGSTYYSLIGSRDRSDATLVNYQSEVISMATALHLTPSYRPTLIITYGATAPPLVTTQAGAMSFTSGTGNGTVVALQGADITRRGFCYMVGTTGTPTTANSVVYDDGTFVTGAYSKPITGLTTGTAYRVCAFAVNSAGTGYGETVTYTTLAAVAPTVTTQAVTNPAATSGTGNGNITATNGADITRRGFCYMVGTTGTPTTANSVVYDDGTFVTGAYSKPITGLTTGTYYTVRAFAVNSAGTGYGASVYYSPQVQLPTVTTQAVSFPTATSGRFNGNITDNGGGYITRRGFCYMVGNTGNPTMANLSIYEDGGNFSIGAFVRLVTGLTPTTTYRVCAFARNTAGYTYGTTVDYTTPTAYSASGAVNISLKVVAANTAAYKSSGAVSIGTSFTGSGRVKYPGSGEVVIGTSFTGSGRVDYPGSGEVVIGTSFTGSGLVDYPGSGAVGIGLSIAAKNTAAYKSSGAVGIGIGITSATTVKVVASGAVAISMSMTATCQLATYPNFTSTGSHTATPSIERLRTISTVTTGYNEAGAEISRTHEIEAGNTGSTFLGFYFGQSVTFSLTASGELFLNLLAEHDIDAEGTGSSSIDITELVFTDCPIYRPTIDIRLPFQFHSSAVATRTALNTKIIHDNI